MNRDGKRFENLDQILRHLVSLGQHEDEIVQVRLIPIYQISDLCQNLTQMFTDASFIYIYKHKAFL